MTAVFISGKTYAKQPPKLTDWFPPEIKPVRKGLYHAYRVGEWHTLKYWNGKRWEQYKGAPWKIAQNHNWRGLAADPTKKGNTYE